jgi:hypothetical protein
MNLGVARKVHFRNCCTICWVATRRCSSRRRWHLETILATRLFLLRLTGKGALTDNSFFLSFFLCFSSFAFGLTAKLSPKA